MNRSVRFLFLIIFLQLFILASASCEVLGIWKTINNRKGFTTSIIAVYRYRSKIYGRVIVSNDEKTGTLIDTMYNPVQTIGRKRGNPFFCSSNLFWDLAWEDSRWTGGTLVDPRNGTIYRCQLWEEDGVLILRGLWGIFGLNQVLFPVEESDYPRGFIVPDIRKFLPVVPIFGE